MGSQGRGMNGVEVEAEKLMQVDTIRKTEYVTKK
jgi:hypothetical protein